MTDPNKRNLLYFEATSMRDLYDVLDTWQLEHQKRFQSVSIEREGEKVWCIALTNPTEVEIVDGLTFQANVVKGALLVRVVP